MERMIEEMEIKGRKHILCNIAALENQLSVLRARLDKYDRAETPLDKATVLSDLAEFGRDYVRNTPAIFALADQMRTACQSR